MATLSRESQLKRGTNVARTLAPISTCAATAGGQAPLSARMLPSIDVSDVRRSDGPEHAMVHAQQPTDSPGPGT